VTGEQEAGNLHVQFGGGRTSAIPISISVDLEKNFLKNKILADSNITTQSKARSRLYAQYLKDFPAQYLYQESEAYIAEHEVQVFVLDVRAAAELAADDVVFQDCTQQRLIAGESAIISFAGFGKAVFDDAVNQSDDFVGAPGAQFDEIIQRQTVVDKIFRD